MRRTEEVKSSKFCAGVDTTMELTSTWTSVTSIYFDGPPVATLTPIFIQGDSSFTVDTRWTNEPNSLARPTFQVPTNTGMRSSLFLRFTDNRFSIYKKWANKTKWTPSCFCRNHILVFERSVIQCCVALPFRHEIHCIPWRKIYEILSNRINSR